MDGAGGSDWKLASGSHLEKTAAPVPYRCITGRGTADGSPIASLNAGQPVLFL
jgi:hypothetical protein